MLVLIPASFINFNVLASDLDERIRKQQEEEEERKRLRREKKKEKKVSSSHAYGLDWDSFSCCYLFSTFFVILPDFLDLANNMTLFGYVKIKYRYHHLFSKKR